jgi:hypothetical protein
MANSLPAFGQLYPKSVCYCGHTGDGNNSDHANTLSFGHGPCLVIGCLCSQFTWADWTTAAKEIIKQDRITQRRLEVDLLHQIGL